MTDGLSDDPPDGWVEERNRKAAWRAEMAEEAHDRQAGLSTIERAVAECIESRSVPTMTTEPAPAIFGLLADVMADVPYVGKDGHNKAQDFRFRGIDGVLNAVGPALRRHRVVVIPRVEEVEISTVEVGKNRSRMAHVQMKVNYRFIAPDGSSISTVVPAEAFDSGDKSISKCMSVAFRTALIQCLALPTNEPDPDSVTYERASAVAVVTVPTPADRFDGLKAATAMLTNPAPVKAWLVEEGIRRGTLTDDLADEWQTRIELAASLPAEEVPV